MVSLCRDRKSTSLLKGAAMRPCPRSHGCKGVNPASKRFTAWLNTTELLVSFNDLKAQRGYLLEASERQRL